MNASQTSTTVFTTIMFVFTAYMVILLEKSN